MPTYDYECDACGHTFEEFQSISADVLVKCPKCGKKKLRRLFGTGAAIVFKGSGFYQTDYRSDSYKKAAGFESRQKENQAKAKIQTWLLSTEVRDIPYFKCRAWHILSQPT